MRSGRYLTSVRDALPEEARGNLDRAFAGDALAARRLMVMAPRRLRGHIAFLAYQSNVGNPAYREVLKSVWGRETRDLLTGFWRPDVVRRMLSRADFSMPTFSGPVAIFQPLRGDSAKKSAAELTWLLSREVALAKAARRVGGPRILQATVEPSDIVYWSDRRGEEEIVTRRAIENAVIVEAASATRVAPAIGPKLATDYAATSHHR